MELVRALDELAALLDIEPSTRWALLAWPKNVADERDADALRSIARRVRLGAPIDVALAPLVAAAGSEAQPLVAAFRSHSATGASLATTVRAIARSIEARRALAHDGRAAGAAAKLSGRMLALFAGASLLLAPMSRGLSPAIAVATTAVASMLVWVGVRWMRRLSPRPPTADDPVASHAEMLASLIRAGVQPSAALDLVGTTPDLARARKLVALGASWPHAIAASGGRDHTRLALVLRRGDCLGLPVAAVLMALAADIRERGRRAFELETRRAPVLLVLPLTLCLLPAFGIVVVVPLLRGLSV